MVVDWLVAMRRLPADRMLDYAIAQRQVTDDTVLTVADYLASFYISSPPVEITAEEYLSQFAQEHRHNRSVLFDTGLLNSAMVKSSSRPDRECFRRSQQPVLPNAPTAHRIIDGHGDLRPEHICLEASPVVIDCLEFNQRLRMVDPIDELTFLSLECARLGAAWIGSMVLQHYCERSGDTLPSELVQFYWAYRACLRARLSLVHILEGDKRKPEKWLPLAQHYLALACSPLSLILPRRSLMEPPECSLLIASAMRGAALMISTRGPIKPGSSSRRVDGIGDIDPVQARIRDKLCRIASEQSMRSKGMNLPRAMLQTCLRGSYDCSARADEIVDHEYDPIFDLTDKKTSCDFPSAAALLNKCA